MMAHSTMTNNQHNAIVDNMAYAKSVILKVRYIDGRVKGRRCVFITRRHGRDLFVYANQLDEYKATKHNKIFPIVRISAKHYARSHVCLKELLAVSEERYHYIINWLSDLTTPPRHLRKMMKEGRI